MARAADGEPVIGIIQHFAPTPDMMNVKRTLVAARSVNIHPDITPRIINQKLSPKPGILLQLGCALFTYFAERGAFHFFLTLALDVGSSGDRPTVRRKASAFCLAVACHENELM